MAKIFVGKTLKLGEKVEISEDALNGLNDAEGKVTPREFTLTLKEVRNKAAVITMVLKMDVAAPQGTMAMDLTGQAIINYADGRPQEFVLDGPLAGNQGGAAITGTMSLRDAYKYW
jgi:hypothetical protein